MKKILSLVLVLLMVFSVVPAVFADTATVAAEESAYQDALDFLKALGFYKGGADVNDDDAITRWQMALFAARFQTGFVEDSYWATTENDVGFPDIAGLEAYQIGAINFAAQQGIVNGFEDGNFRPNDGIQYRDALVMVVRALGTQYAASGYPWSYIKTAREMGLTDGIENIGWTDEITREVVAQILYNAFFVEVEGETVAEEVFNVGEATVMITATNDYVYSNDYAPVFATGYVQFQVVDEQGKPTGAAYHVPAANFGLNTKAEQTAAIGDVYLVAYKNDFNTVLGAKNLTADYANNGANGTEFTVTTDAYGYYLNIGGQKAKLVSNFTNLFNADRANSTPSGVAEAKLYEANVNASVFTGTKVIGDNYALYPDGWVYDLATLSAVGFYSEYVGAWYTYAVDATTGAGTFTLIQNPAANAMVKDLMNKTTGYALNTAPTVSAYSQLTAADINNDGMFDAALLKNYQLGRYVKKVEGNVTAGFTIETYGKVDANGEIAVSTSSWYKTAVKPNQNPVTDTVNAYMSATSAAVMDGDYILFYVDPINMIVDIAMVIPEKTSDAQSTYVTTGYALGYFQSSNVIFLDDGDGRNDTINIGYNNLMGSAYYTFNTGANATQKTANNNALIANLTDLVNAQTRVDVVVIDGNLVYVANATATNDYVYIDSFATIDESGIYVNAYTTVTDSAAVIKVAEYEGWDLNGFDWNTYWNEFVYSQIIAGNASQGFNFNAYLEQFIPVKTDRFYRVISVNGDAYNLGETAVAGADLSVQVGAGHMKYTAAAFGTSAVWTYTNAADFWLIYVEDAAADEAKIIPVSGKVGNFTASGLSFYKFDKTSMDYVISGTKAELAELLNSLKVDTSEKVYVAWDHTPNYVDYNTKWDYLAGGYYFERQMTNVVTGAAVRVRFTGETVAEVQSVIDAVYANATADSDAIYVATVNATTGKVELSLTATAAGNIKTLANVVEALIAGEFRTHTANLNDLGWNGVWGTGNNGGNTVLNLLYAIQNPGSPVPGNWATSGGGNYLVTFDSDLNEYVYVNKDTGATKAGLLTGKTAIAFYDGAANAMNSIVFAY